MQKTIFISYSNKDSEFVYKFKNDLNEVGINTWIDIEQIEPGSMWQDEIKLGIQNSEIVILVLSNNYLTSNWVSFELALANDKKIIPIKIDNVSFEVFSNSIRNIQWIDFSNNYKNGLNLLLQSIPNSFKNTEPIKPNKVKSKGYVFISFTENDTDFVQKLRSFLKSQDFAYWDYEEGERNYHIQFFLELESVIEDSVAVLSLISSSWKLSKWATREYFYSEEIGKPIFLLRCKILEPTLAIAGQPYIDFVIDEKLGFKKLEKELNKRLKETNATKRAWK